MLTPLDILQLRRPHFTDIFLVLRDIDSTVLQSRRDGSDDSVEGLNFQRCFGRTSRH